MMLFQSVVSKKASSFRSTVTSQLQKLQQLENKQLLFSAARSSFHTITSFVRWGYYIQTTASFHFTP
jgi:hypothetical protein